MVHTKKVQLKDAYALFSVAELRMLCKSFGIHGVSKKRKADIITVLVQHMTQRQIFESICFLATPYEIFALKQSDKCAYDDTDPYDVFYYWIKFGYCIIDDENQVIIVSEVKEMIHNLSNGFWEQHDRFHEILTYIEASIHLYGVMEIKFFIELFNRFHSNQLCMKEFMSVFQMLDGRPELFNYDIDHNIMFDEVLLDTESGRFAFEEIYEKQQRFPYYIPTKEELLCYVDEEYSERTKEYKSLYEYFEDVYRMEPYFIEDTCNETVDMIRFGYQIEEILQLYEVRGIELDPFHIDDIVNLLLQLMNHTRSMYFRGHTPAEVNLRIELADPKRMRKNTYHRKHDAGNDIHEVIQFPGKRTQ